MKKEKTISVLFLVQSAMIAAIYVVLTIVFAPISFGQIQFSYRRSTDHPARLSLRLQFPDSLWDV